MVDTSREAVEKRASVLYSEAGCASELGHGRFAAHYLEARDMLLALLSERDQARAELAAMKAKADEAVEAVLGLICSIGCIFSWIDNWTTAFVEDEAWPEDRSAIESKTEAARAFIQKYGEK